MVQVGKEYIWLRVRIPNLSNNTDPHSAKGQHIINEEGFNTAAFSSSCGALEGVLLPNPIVKVWSGEVWFKGGIRVDLTTKTAVKWNGKPLHNRFSEALVQLADLVRQNWVEFM